MVGMMGSSLKMLFPARREQAIGQHGQEQQRADDDQVQLVPRKLPGHELARLVDEQDAQHRPQQAAPPAEDAGAAQHHGGDDV